MKGYDPALGSKTYLNISGAIGYFHPVSWDSFHLVIHQAIHIPTLDHHLLCPMQCCVAGVNIKDCPKCLTPFPQEDSHYIIAADEFRARNVLPLSIQGVTSIWNVFKITEGGGEL